MNGLIFDIRHFSVHDGPGIRTAVFLKGCPLSCIWCHNPESQLFEPETCVRSHKLEEKEFKVDEIIGRSMSVNEVLNEIKKDIPIFDESKGGVTFSGGEPLSQPDFLLEMLKRCKSMEIHTAVDTCGFAKQEILQGLIPFTNLFLFDLKLASDSDHKKFTGVSNAIILKNLELIIQSEVKVIIRIPLIKDITDTEENLKSLKKIISQYPSIQRVDVLPFHNIAKSKYERFGKKYQLKDAEPYDDKKAEQIRDYFMETIPFVSIGG